MSPDFLEKLFLQSVGPLVTAVVGTLIFGTFVAWITRRAQERRADSQLQEERTRSENQLRVQLVGQMTETASSLYMATQHFWRKKDREKLGKDELDQHRKELDVQYRASRVQGELIERQLEAYYLDSEVRVHWHAVMDLLTVRYFNLIDLMTDKLLEENAGNEHSGLSVKELRNQTLVLETFREKLKESVRAVLEGHMRPLAGGGFQREVQRVKQTGS